MQAIMCDQLQAIFGDETAVEQIQNKGPFRYLLLILYMPFHAISTTNYCNYENATLLCDFL